MEKVRALGSGAWGYRTVLKMMSAWQECCPRTDCSKQQTAAAVAAGETAVGVARVLGEDFVGTYYVTVVDVTVGTSFASNRTRYFEEDSRCELAIVGVC